MADTLTLALHGDVTVEEFADAMGRWRNLVDGLTRDVDVTWFISDLAAGSATVTARAVGKENAVVPVTTTYAEVGRALARGELDAVPAEVRADAIALTSLINGHVEFIRFETAEDDAVITTNYDAILERAVIEVVEVELPAALGGVQGHIQTLTSRGALRFTLYDTLFDRAVGCYLSEGQEEIMRDVWGKMAVVEGVVTRDPRTGRPLTIRHVRNVTPTRRVDPDAYRAARGAVQREATDPRSPETLIAAARDE